MKDLKLFFVKTLQLVVSPVEFMRKHIIQQQIIPAKLTAPKMLVVLDANVPKSLTSDSSQCS